MPNTQSDKPQDFGKTLLTYWPILLPVCLALLSLGGIYVKLDSITEFQKEQKQQYYLMAERQNTTGQLIVQLQGKVDNVSAEASRNTTAITDLNNRVNAINDKIRWTPK